MAKRIKVATFTSITPAAAVELLRKYIAKLPADPEPEFKPGDAVMLDTGWVGVVHSVDPDEGTANVYYINGDGIISGPAFGYRLTKLEV